jgi:hypothetical protein
MQNFYTVKPQYLANAVALNNKIAKFANKVVPQMIAILDTHKETGKKTFLTGGGLVAKLHDSLYDVLNKDANGRDNNRLRAILHVSNYSIHVEINSNYQSGENTCTYIKETIYLYDIDRDLMGRQEPTLKSLINPFTPKKTNTVKQIETKIVKLRKLEKEVREAEDKFNSIRSELRNFES